MPDFEKLEQEADEALKAMYPDDGDDDQGSPKGDGPSDTEQATGDDANNEDVSAETTDTGDMPPDDGDLTLKNAEERIKNAQARMTRATQEAADLRKQIEPLQSENQRLSQEVATLKAQIDELNNRIGARDDTPDTHAAKSADDLDEVLDEYPDIVGPVVRHNKVLQEKLDALSKQLEMVSGTVAHQQEASAQEAHMAEIRSVHPDVDQIAGSDDFLGWVARQPPLVQQAVQAGTAQDVILILDQYKAAVGKSNRLEEARAAASPATPRARKPPTSRRPVFTREQIAAMSSDEFAKNEQAIDEAMAAGLIQ